MSKTMYLIIFLSVVLINSQTTFAQNKSLKKELGICGKTMSTLLKIHPKTDPELDTNVMRDEEFCDNGRYEKNANFIVYLYNAKNELVYDKHIYLNPLSFKESFEPKNPEKFKKVQIDETHSSRIIKFPVSKEMGEVASYKIESLENKKTSEMKKINW